MLKGSKPICPLRDPSRNQEPRTKPKRTTKKHPVPCPSRGDGGAGLAGEAVAMQRGLGRKEVLATAAAGLRAVGIDVRHVHLELPVF